GSSQNSALLCYQRKYVSRSSKILRFGRIVNKGFNGLGPVMNGNTCCAAVAFQVYRHRKLCVVKHRIFSNHKVKVQVLTASLGKWSTNKSSSVGSHDLDHLRGRLFSSSNEVPVIFPVFIIDHDHHLSGSDVVNGFFNTVQFQGRFLNHDILSVSSCKDI